MATFENCMFQGRPLHKMLIISKIMDQKLRVGILVFFSDNYWNSVKSTRWMSKEEFEDLLLTIKQYAKTWNEFNLDWFTKFLSTLLLRR